MSENKVTPLFQVGDTVQLKMEPYVNCLFGLNPKMKEYFGQTATIIRLRKYALGRGTAYGYTVDIDGGNFLWCEGCFDGAIYADDIEESEADISMLFS